ncbi:hypothetical protein MMC21_007481 [Puttea exsequens]|nr:hypothetical protein [Puttea exsequens]
MYTFTYFWPCAFSLYLHSGPSDSLAVPRSLNATGSLSDSQNPTHCGFDGNSDILGIGIRIGYYTQALSVWFANYFVASEAKVLRSINLLFLVALFVGLVWLAHAPQQTFAIEIFLLLRLLFATWYVGVLDRSKFTQRNVKKSNVRVVIREASLLGLLAYSVWFAWVGLDRLEKTPCGTWIFFATKVNLYGWYRSAFKVLTLFCLCCGALKQVSTAAQLYQRWRPSIVKSSGYFSRLQESFQLSDKTQNGDIDAEKVSQASTLHGGSPKRTIGLTRNGISCLDTGLRDLEAAIQIPLPASPTETNSTQRGKALNVNRRKGDEPVKTASVNGLPSFEVLIAADQYLEKVINVDVSRHSAWCYEIKCIHLKVFLPIVHSPKTLLRRLRSVFACRPFRPTILFILFRHIRSLKRFPAYSYFIMAETALQDPQHKLISSTTLLTTLVLHRARLPSHRPTPNILISATVSLLMCIGLILGIELAIRWNHITSMGNIGAVGQLIPAIIGVGGMTRVGWVRWTKGEMGEVAEDSREKEIRECSAVYEKLRMDRVGKARVHVSGL